MKTKYILRFTLIILFLLHYNSFLYSEEINRDVGEKHDGISYGLFFNIGSVYNKANILNIPGHSTFPVGQAAGFNYGGYYGVFATIPAFKINERYTSIGLRLSFLNNVPKLSFDNNEPGRLTSRVNTRSIFEWVALAPTIQYNFWSDLYGLLGLQFNIPIIAESILSDYNGHILNDTLSFDRTKPQIYFQLGVSYIMPIFNSNFFVAPEANMLIGLNNTLPQDFSGSWRSKYFLIGASFQYRNKIDYFMDIKKTYDSVLTVDTVKCVITKGEEKVVEGQVVLIETLENKIDAQKIYIVNHYQRTDTLFLLKNKMFDIEARVFAVDTTGKKHIVNNKYSFAIEEILTTQDQPLLNYIFFEKGSSAIDKRYNQLQSGNTENFDTDIKSWTTFDTYYNMLNIVGKRMQLDTNYTLNIEGCNDDNSYEEKGNYKLSTARAEVVKNYLKKNWQIKDNRLKITAKGLPENPSLGKGETLKMQENRRTELIPNDISLFDPISLETRTYTTNIEKIKLAAKIFSAETISNYIIIVSCGEEVVFSKSVDNPKLEDNVIIINEEWDNLIVPKEKKNEYKIFIAAVDKNMRYKSFKLSFPVYFYNAEELIKIGRDRQIYKYNLILFDFKTASVGNRNSRIIQKINEKIVPDAKVTIIGYTDITGKEKFNEKLAIQRAEATKEALKLEKAIIQSSDNSTQLYDNTLPEGRFYSRTVEIIVTPPLLIGNDE